MSDVVEKNVAAEVEASVETAEENSAPEPTEAKGAGVDVDAVVPAVEEDETMKVVDEVGADDDDSAGDGKEKKPADGDAPAAVEKEQPAKADAPAPASKPPVDVSAALDAMRSVVDFLDVMKNTELPKDLLEKVAQTKSIVNRDSPDEKSARAAPISVKPARQEAKEVAERDSGAEGQSVLRGGRLIARPIVPKAGKGFWNLYRTAQLINRALDVGVAGVQSVDETYTVYANTRGRNAPEGDRGTVVTCRGRVTNARSSQIAHMWLRAVPMTEARALALKGPFRGIRGPSNGRPFDPKLYGLPKQCSLTYGKHEESGGPGIHLGFPEQHGWPAAGVKGWADRPASLRALEQTGAEIERLSNLQSVALETFLTNLLKLAEDVPEMKEKFEALQDQVQDLRDLDVLMANRALVNFDLITKTSKKIVMDSMPVVPDTFNRYWRERPSRVLFPDPTTVRGFRRVIPDRKAIDALERRDAAFRRKTAELDEMEYRTRRMKEETEEMRRQTRREEEQTKELLERRRREEEEIERRRREEEEFERRRRKEEEERRRREEEEERRRREEKLARDRRLREEQTRKRVDNRGVGAPASEPKRLRMRSRSPPAHGQRPRRPLSPVPGPAKAYYRGGGGDRYERRSPSPRGDSRRRQRGGVDDDEDADADVGGYDGRRGFSDVAGGGAGRAYEPEPTHGYRGGRPRVDVRGGGGDVRVNRVEDTTAKRTQLMGEVERLLAVAKLSMLGGSAPVGGPRGGGY